MEKDIEKRARCYASSQKPFGDKTDLILGYENGAKEQIVIDIETIPPLYIRWILIDDTYGFEKPSWEEYATKAMEYIAKYDFTNETPFNEQPLYKQGYGDAVDKFCELLKANIHNDLSIGTYADTIQSIIDDFRKAMEE